MLVTMPRICVSLAGGFATHKLGRGEVEELLYAFDLFGNELSGAISLLCEFGLCRRVTDAEGYEDATGLEEAVWGL